jgi:hypothetical protein
MGNPSHAEASPQGHPRDCIETSDEINGTKAG